MGHDLGKEHVLSSVPRSPVPNLLMEHGGTGVLPLGAPFSESHTGLPRTSASVNRAHLCRAPTLAINGRVGVTRRGWLPSCGSQARAGRRDQAEEADLVFQLRSTEREGSESHQERGFHPKHRSVPSGNQEGHMGCGAGNRLGNAVAAQRCVHCDRIFGSF